MSKHELVFTFRLPFTLKKRKNWILSSCPILDVHSQGPTEEKAVENLREALTLFFVSCFERGTLDEVLKECGFVSTAIDYKMKPQPFENEIDIPIPFYHNQQRRQQRCHA